MRVPCSGPSSGRRQSLGISRLIGRSAGRLVQQHAASFIAHTEDSTGSELPGFIKDEFDGFLECGILAHGFLRLRCGDCGHNKLLAFSCKRRGFCPSCGARGVAAAGGPCFPTCPRIGG